MRQLKGENTLGHSALHGLDLTELRVEGKLPYNVWMVQKHKENARPPLLSASLSFADCFS